MDPLKFGICLLIFLWNNFYLLSQPSRCGTIPVMENDCSDACIVCDLDGLTLQNGHTIPGNAPPGYCTMVVHSIRYIGFIAGSTNIGFSVTVNSCTLGNSIELGVYESINCSNFSLVSNCNTYMPVGGTYQFTATNLKVGCHYYIVIDGNGPAICTFTIAVTSGSTKAPVPTIGNIDGPKKFCVGESAEYMLSNLSGACDFEWTVTNGILSTNSMNRATIEWNTKGIGTICYNAKNACNSTSKCVDIEIGDASPTEIINEMICENSSFIFNGTPYGIGNYEFKLKNHFGCDSTIELNIEPIPENRKSIDSIICYPDCVSVGGKQYCTDGNYLHLEKSKIKPYCDSITELNLTVLKIIPKIIQIGKISCTNNTVILSSDSSIITGIGQVTRRWYDDNNNLIDSINQISVDHSGKFKLVIRLLHPNGKYCEKSAEYELIGNSKTPDLIPIPTIRFCKNQYFNFKNLDIKDNNLTGSNYSFYSNYPFISAHKIIDSLLITSDSTIYLLADNQGCSDTSEILIKIIPTISTTIPELEYCEGDTIHLSDIILIHSDSIDGISNFFSCTGMDTSCKLDFPILAQKDMLIYFTTYKEQCAFLNNFTIKVIPVPVLNASIDKTTVCAGTELKLYLNQLDSNEIRTIIHNLKDTIAQVQEPLTLTNLSSGKHSIKVYLTNKRCTLDTTINFTVFVPDTLPLINCYSKDSSITFYWKKTNLRNKLEFESDLNQNISLVTPDSVVFSNLIPGTKIKFKLIIKDSLCGDQSIDAECEATQCPNFDITITGRDSFCLDNNGKLKLNFSALIDQPDPKFTGRWSGIGVTDSINGIYEFNLAKAGHKTIIFEYSNNSCKTSITKEIWIRRNPLALFTINEKVCQDSNTIINFSGKDTLDDISEWDFSDAFISQNNSNKNFLIRWNKVGKKRIQLKIQNSICQDNFEKEIDVIPNPELPLIECMAQDSNLVFTWKKGLYTDSIQFQVQNGNNIQILNDSTLYVGGLAPLQKVKLILRSKGFQPCGSLLSELECETKDCPPVKLLRENSVILCIKSKNEVVDLSSYLLNSVSNSVWNSPIVVENRFLNLSTLGTGTFCIPAFSQQDLCKYFDTLCITAGEIPEVDFGLKKLYCFNDPDKGKIWINGYTKGVQPLSFIFENQEWDINHIQVDLNKGQYKIRITDSIGCIKDTSFNIEKSDSLGIDLGSDKEVEKGTPIQLNSSIIGSIQSVKWDPADFLNCTDCFDPIAVPERNIEYIATIVDQYGCSDKDTLNIRARDNRIYVPNVFSPNGDGINDYFTIFGTTDVQQIIFLNIYDRWGELVFTKFNFPLNQETEGWNGTFKNTILNPAVFAYRAEILFSNNKREFIKGEITLLR
ncbi:MAG: gliding motility-associated C-terminal domain-containing protein [Saprospiraceae bacterium]|nr:gliding motility-associated C-terminal domain-containing protein [Saprospiraceae bacterium]